MARALILSIACCLYLLFPSSAAGQVIFHDDFDNGASPLWGNEVGGWYVQNGHYDASSIIFYGPITYSSLPYVLTDFSVEVKFDTIGDGGIWLRSTDNENGILLVTGGDGFGPYGNNIFGSGDRLYFHVIENSVITETIGYQPPGVITRREGDYVVRVDVVGDEFKVYLDNILTLTMTDDTYSSGKVALCDNYYYGQSADYITVTAIPEVGATFLVGCSLALTAFGSRLRNRFQGNS